MFNEIPGMADNTRDQNLAVGQLHVLPNIPLVVVAGVGSLDGVGLRANLQYQVDDIPEGDVE